MDKTDRLRNYGLAFLLYKQGLSVCGYELIRELFIFIKLILNSYLYISSNIDEQQAIATILNKMDNEITALEAKKAKYEAIKQGMMQQLLTGKIRLIS